MKYNLSEVQLFDLYCGGRDCETCEFYGCVNCREGFYEYLEQNYEAIEVNDER